ncbi:MAG: hypothetical protein GY952_01115, partial [Rhodobacteraceae bacterium]|nr:hypothetical protein [Paracoccaceae bacterium]
NAETGEEGTMAIVEIAANDPVFFLHHGNIDRLWAYWDSLGEDRSSPVDNEDWMDYVFTFVDEGGEGFEMTPREVLTTEGLGYVYDVLDPTGVEGATAAAGSGPITTCTDPVEPEILLALRGSESAPSLQFTKGRVTAAIPVTAAPEALSEALGNDNRVTLTLEGISTKMQPMIVPIYVNLPEDSAPDIDGPYFAGALSVFGSRNSEMQMDWDQSVDISDLLNEQRSAGLYSGGPVTVTLAGSVRSGLRVSSLHISQ